MFFQIPYLRKIGVTLRFGFRGSQKAVKRTLKLMVPGLFGAGIYQINIIVAIAIASYLGKGAVSSLQYSNRLMELPLGVFVVAVSTVILPKLSQHVTDQRLDALKDTLAYAVRLVAFLTLPCLVGLLLVRYPLIRLLLGYGQFGEESIRLTTWAFLFHVPGLTLIGISRVYVPAFYAMKDMVTPVKIAFVAMVVHLAACLLLAEPLGNGGIALGNTLAVAIQVVFLILWLGSKIGHLNWKTLGGGLLRIGLASGAMGLAVYFSLSLFPDTNIPTRWGSAYRLGVAVAVGVSSYLAFCMMLKVSELKDVAAILLRRKR